MIRRHHWLAAFAVFALLSMSAAAEAADEASAAYGGLLAKYVSAGPNGINLVDYAKWKASKADRGRLDDHVAHLQTLKPSGMNGKQAFVFWANLYNATTLKIVLDHYPVASIRDIKSEGAGFLDFKAFYGPWRTKLLTVEGRKMSLDDIEHETLRKRFDDPRIHYAVNCASIGCPNIRPRPWAADSLDADLDAAAKAYVNHPRGVSVRADGGLEVSSIYVWFQEDFGGSESGVIRHLSKYAEPALKKKLALNVSIASDRYNWALNDPANADAVR